MKKILVITTGGTIASTENKDGLTPTISSEKLIGFLNYTNKSVTIDSINLYSIDSTDILTEHWLQLVACIKKNYNFYDGFVITHGTDTLAYTASALSYMIQKSPKPIVITGAQKSIQMDITDAKTNLKDAINYAAYPYAHDVTVVFGGKIIPGTRARKNRSKSFDAFTSINYPELGLILDDMIVDYIENHSKATDVLFFTKLDTNVLLLKLYPGIDKNLISYALSQYKVLIIESFGLGGIPIDLYQAMKDHPLAQDKIIILTTQVTLEGSDILIYEVGRRTLKDLNILESYDMTTESAVTKAMWALEYSHGDLEIFKSLYYKRINFDYCKKFSLKKVDP